MRRLVREISYTFHGNDFMIVYGIKDINRGLNAVILVGYDDLISDKMIEICPDNEEMYLEAIRGEFQGHSLDWYPTMEEAIAGFFLENRDFSEILKDRP